MLTKSPFVLSYNSEGWNTVMHDYTIEYPNCVYSDSYLDTDCGSVAWAFALFLSFNIISMYIFTAMFVVVVLDNFSYVYQIAANFSLVTRDEIRKYPFIVDCLALLGMSQRPLSVRSIFPICYMMVFIP